MMTNKFIDKNITPHVPYLFNWSFCTNCQNLMEPKLKQFILDVLHYSWNSLMEILLIL